MGFKWPDNWKEVPLLQKVVGKTAHFKDGTTKDVDAIILCTGYLHHFPFLAEDLRLKTGNRMWPVGLYKGVVWEDNPQLFYIGMQDQFYTFNMFDAQAWFARDVIMGRIKLPSAEAMAAHGQKWREREETLENAEQMIWFQGDYTRELIDADRLSVLRHRGDQPDLHGMGAPQGRKHHGLPRQRLPLADDRHHGADAPHAVAAGDGRFAGELSPGEGGGGGVGG